MSTPTTHQEINGLREWQRLLEVERKFKLLEKENDRLRKRIEQREHDIVEYQRRLRLTEKIPEYVRSLFIRVEWNPYGNHHTWIAHVIVNNERVTEAGMKLRSVLSKIGLVLDDRPRDQMFGKDLDVIP